MNSSNDPSLRARSPRRLQVPLLATGLVSALLVVGCNRAEAPETAPAAPASSAPAPAQTPAPASPAPSSSAPSSAPTSSANTPGTPDGARASLPSGDKPAESTPTAGTASDAKETNPKGNLTKQEESKGMPEALQAGNNHSSTALDTEPKKP